MPWLTQPSSQEQNTLQTHSLPARFHQPATGSLTSSSAWEGRLSPVPWGPALLAVKRSCASDTPTESILCLF